MNVFFVSLSYIGAALILKQCWPYFFSKPVPSPTKEENEYPLVSVIVPARNEEKSLPHLLDSLLKSDYPKLEIIVVDDQSTDQTYEVASKYTATVIKAPSKPAGWIGKNWACSIGAKAALGELLLFTDADTVHTPSGLRQSVSYLLYKKAALLSAPSFHANKHWWEKLLAPFYFLVNVAVTPYNKPSLKTPYAIGQYLLFDAAFYKKLGGHTVSKSSLAEDAELARQTLKQKGKYVMYTEHRLFSVQMFDSFKSFIAGWNRLLRLGMHYMSFYSVFISTLAICALTSALSHPTKPVYWVPTLIALLGIVAVQRKVGNFSFGGLFLFPLSALLFILLGLWASVQSLLDLPMEWRGRIYSQTGNIYKPSSN